MNSLTFESKYQMYKVRIKLWESDFIQKHGRKPTKDDIKIADSAIRESYKMYYTLKTKISDNTLTNVTLTDVVEEMSDHNHESSPLFGSDMETRESAFKQLPENTENFTLEKDAINVIDVWKHNLNHQKCNINSNTTANNCFRLLQNKFTNIKFPNRNPRKSNYMLKQTSKLIEDMTCINKEQQYDDLNSIDKCKVYSLNIESMKDNLKVVHSKNNLSTQQINTVEQLIKNGATSFSDKKLNHNWLNNYLGSNELQNSNLQINDDFDLKILEQKTNLYTNSKSTLVSSMLLTSNKDYICNSDYEEQRNCKRKRNVEKLYDNSQLFKKPRVYNDVSIGTKRAGNVFSNNDFINNTENKINLNEIKDLSSLYYCLQTAEKSSFTKSDENVTKVEHISIGNNSEEITKNNAKLLDKLHDSNLKEMTSKNLIFDCPSMIGSVNSKGKSIHSKLMKTCLNNKEILEQKAISGSLNENYIKINLKKKVFARGQKAFKFSKYKKNQWKKKTTDIYSNKNILELKNGNVDNSLCYRNFKENSLPFTVNPNTFIELPIEENATNSNKNVIKGRSTTKSYCSSSSVFNINSTENIKFDHMQLISSNTISSYDSPKNFVKKLIVPPTQEVEPLYKLEDNATLKDTPLEVLAALKKFNHSSFREGQEKAIMRILSGQSTLVTLPTGSGKSLCYQLPAYMYAKKGNCITLVISPLVSLMNDQVSGIPNFLPAACLHSNQSSKLRSKVFKDLTSGKLRVLLVSPETIIAGDNSSILYSLFQKIPPIAFACIDEAHCISQWSHNFRPSYFMICKILRETLGIKTILGLTATATRSTIMSIINLFNIEDGMAGVIVERPLPVNLHLTVSRDEYREQAVIQLLNSDKFTECNSIIIYCTRREECKRVASLLRVSLKYPESEFMQNKSQKKSTFSPIAEAYHAGLSAYKRKLIQDAFMKSEIRIIVATVAFGMGINKSNIRSVIHFNMPSSIENYVQEVGRAGRDGLPAYCHVFLNSKENFDEYELRRHIYSNSVDRHTIRRLLQYIFIPCSCAFIESNPTIRCTGHEIAFSIDETVKILDISEETIATLLSYLELHPKRFIKVLQSTYIIAKVCSSSGPQCLKLAAQNSPPLAMAIDVFTKKGIFSENSSYIEFPVINIAAAIGWDSCLVKNHLKDLEWITVEGKNIPSSLSVKFSTLGFRVQAPGDLTNEELETALEFLNERCNYQENLRLQQLQCISTMLRKFSYLNVNNCFDTNDNINIKSEALKNAIRSYFESDSPLPNITVSTETSAASKARQAEIFNSRRRPAEFEVGDLVWKRNRILSSSAQGISAKLAPKYTGPYLIINRKGMNTYVIQDDQGDQEVSHIEHLKRYVPENDADSTDEDQREQPQPPKDQQVKCDPPVASECSPARENNASESPGEGTRCNPRKTSRTSLDRSRVTRRQRGRPQKATATVKRRSPIERYANADSEPVPSRRGRGRPPGSRPKRT